MEMVFAALIEKKGWGRNERQGTKNVQGGSLETGGGIAPAEQKEEGSLSPKQRGTIPLPGSFLGRKVKPGGTTRLAQASETRGDFRAKPGGREMENPIAAVAAGMA
jgi:hypothetical protein